MAAGIIRIGLVALTFMSAAAYGQNNVAMAPSTSAPIHPGTAILDAMGIFASSPVQAGAPVHPGTAILDSMGIFAGLPAPGAPNGNTAAVTQVIPK